MLRGLRIREKVWQLATDVRERGDCLAEQALRLREVADQAVWEGPDGAEFLATLRTNADRCEAAAADLRHAADLLDAHAVRLESYKPSESRLIMSP